MAEERGPVVGWKEESGGIRDVGGEGEWPGQQLPSPH